MDYMEIALWEAEKALKKREIPVGAVIVKDGEVIAKAHNLKETLKMPTGHAEILAIEEACKRLDNWRLSGAEMYVTLEPCPMCAGAIIQSRIPKVYFGAFDPKGGCFGSCVDFREIEGFNHYPNVQGGILQEECAMLLKEFFKSKRKNKGE